MNTPHLPTFDQLRRRHGGRPVVPTERLPEARRVIGYLASLGFAVLSANDIVAAINYLDGEEELAAYRCVEGAAVSHASEGWWLLFPTGDLAIAGVVGVASQPSPQREERSC